MRYSNNYELDTASITEDAFHQYLENIINGVEQPPLHITSLKDGEPSDEYPIVIRETDAGEVEIAIVETFVPDEMQDEWEERLESDPYAEVLAPIIMLDSSFNVRYDPRELLDRPFEEIMNELKSEYDLEMDFDQLLNGGLISVYWELEDEVLAAIGDDYATLITAHNSDAREFAAAHGFGLDILAYDEDKCVRDAVEAYIEENSEGYESRVKDVDVPKKYFDFTNTIDTNEDIEEGSDTDKNTGEDREYANFVLWLYDEQYKALYERAPFEKGFKDAFDFDTLLDDSGVTMNCYALLYKDKQIEVALVVDGDDPAVGWRSATIELNDEEKASLLTDMYAAAKVNDYPIARFLNELPVPVTYNLKDAQAMGTVDEWSESRKENKRCAESIAYNINESYRNNHLDVDAAIDEVRNHFSDERIDKVLAHDIFRNEQSLEEFQNSGRHYDGRISREVAAWAASIVGSFENGEAHNYSTCPSIKDATHPVLTNSFIESYLGEKRLERGERSSEQKASPSKARTTDDYTK